MADYLVYWKDYWHEIRNKTDLKYLWYTAQENFYARVQRGDQMWVIISPNGSAPRWRLVEKLVVRRKTHVPKLSRCYKIVGNDESSRKFNIATQSDLMDLLHQLQFESGKQIIARGKKVGLHLQRIRRLTEVDAGLLTDYSLGLDVSSRRR